MRLADLFLAVGADDSALDKDLKGSENKALGWLGGLTGKLSGLVGGAIAGVVGGAVGLIGSAISGEVIDQAFDNILIKTGATGEAMNMLQGEFRDLFRAIPTEAGPASDVLATLYQRANLSGDALQNTSQKVLEASRLLKEDASSNAELFTRVIGDWSLSGDQASSTMDKLFVASQQTGIGMGDLMSKVVQFGSPLRLMGFTLEDSIALFGKWEKEGVNAELVMGSLRIAAGKFAESGKPLRESLLGTFDAIKNNKDATAALALGMDVFGARAGPDMVAAIREGRFSIDDLAAAMGNADGAIMSTAKKTEDWGEKLTKLKNKAMVALEPIGGRILDLSSNLIDRAGPALDWVIDKLDKYLVPAVDKVFDSLDMLASGDIAGAVGNLFGPDATAVVDGFIERVKGVVDQALGAFDFLGNWWIINGPGLTEAAGTFFGGIKTLIDGVVERFGPFIEQTFAKVMAWLLDNGPLIQQTAQTIADFFSNQVVPAVMIALDIIMPLLTGLVDILLNLGTLVMQVITGDWAGAWQTAQTIFFTAVDAIGASVLVFLNAIAGLFGTSLAEIGATWSTNWMLLGAIIEQVKGIVVEKVNGLIANVKEVFNTDWGEVGKQIIQGIANGISNGVGTIIGAAKQAAEAALVAAKEALGINSPSKEAEEQVGSPLAEGIGVGVRKQEGALRQSLTDMLQGAMNGLGVNSPQLAMAPVPAINLPTSGTTVQIINNSPLQIFDEYALQNMLTPVVDRIMRDKRVSA